MSSGSFVSSIYETDGGVSRPIRIQPETLTDWNPAGDGPAVGTLIRVSGGKNRIGLKARSVTLKQNVGAAVNGYQPTRPARVAVMTETAWEALTLGESVTYLGTQWTVAGKTKESGR